MIRINYTPQSGPPGKRLAYSWSGRVLTATLEPDGTREVCDFSGLQPGDRVTEITPDVLPFSPVVSAEVDAAGDLHVTLLYWYGPGDPPEKASEVIDG